MLAAQAIATRYAERECPQRASVEGLPEKIADILHRQPTHGRRAAFDYSD